MDTAFDALGVLIAIEFAMLKAAPLIWIPLRIALPPLLILAIRRLVKP